MLKSVSLLWLGSVLGSFAAFVTQIALARLLGPEEFGAFVSVLAAVTLTAPFAAFGVGGFWLKAFGEEGWAATRWIYPSLIFSTISTTIIIFIIFLWAIFGPHDDRTARLFTILGFYVVGQAVIELVSARIQLEERFGHLAYWQFFPHGVRLCGVLIAGLAVGEGLSSETIAFVYATVAGGLLIFALFHMRMLTRPFELKGHGSPPVVELKWRVACQKLPAVVKETWPFGAVGVLFLIYFQSDIVLLKYLASDEQAGMYNVAFVILIAVYLLPSAVYQKYLMPKIHRWAHQDFAKLYRVYSEGARVMAGLGALAALVVIAIGPNLIEVMFGESYLPAVPALLVLAFAIPLRFMSTGFGAVLMTSDYVRTKAKYMAFVAVCNVLLNVALIPAYGIIGAAVATVISETVLLISYWLAVQRMMLKRGV